MEVGDGGHQDVAGGDSQCRILNNLKLGQGARCSERYPDGRSIVQYRPGDGLVRLNQCLFVKSPVCAFQRLVDPKATGTPCDDVSCMRREGEVSIPGDAQDFRGAIQGNHVVTYLDLRVHVRLVGVRGEQSHR